MVKVIDPVAEPAGVDADTEMTLCPAVVGIPEIVRVELL
jgi:hypothetical protein